MKRILMWTVLTAEWWIGAALIAFLLLGPLATRHSPLATDHDGQPSHCTNAKTAPAAHKCECKKTEDACDVEDKKCKVYCRKDHCHCFHPACDS